VIRHFSFLIFSKRQTIWIKSKSLCKLSKKKPNSNSVFPGFFFQEIMAMSSKTKRGLFNFGLYSLLITGGVQGFSGVMGLFNFDLLSKIPAGSRKIFDVAFYGLMLVSVIMVLALKKSSCMAPASS
jgi:uncharacterized membrane protein YuzA (DUF378 family)